MKDRAYSLACNVAVIFVTLATVIGELVPGFKGALAKLTGHHWVSKGVIATVLFVVVSVIVSKTQKSDTKPGWSVLMMTVAGSAVLTLFYIIHYFNH